MDCEVGKSAMYYLSFSPETFTEIGQYDKKDAVILPEKQSTLKHKRKNNNVLPLCSVHIPSIYRPEHSVWILDMSITAVLNISSFVFLQEECVLPTVLLQHLWSKIYTCTESKNIRIIFVWHLGSMGLDRTFTFQVKLTQTQVKLDVIWIPKATKQPVQQ